MNDLEAALKGLMLRALDGDVQARRELLTLLGDRLRAYFTRRMSAIPADVEDLVQETLLAVHLRQASYDRAQLFTPWVYAIARYKLIDHGRRRKLRYTLALDDVSESLSAPAAASDEGLDLTRALDTLPQHLKTLVQDVKVDGLSLAEAGARAGVSEGAAKVALHRALKTLAERMRRAYG